MPTSKLLTALLFFAGIAPAEELTRAVNNNTVTSKNLPAAKLELARAFRYAGGDRFPLYGVAVAELHLFTDADAQGNIKRFFWLQFEQYLPGNTNTYSYNVPGKADIGALQFVYDTSLFTDYRGMNARPDSDSQHMRELLAKANLALPQSMARIRLVNLAADRRSELMIIYGEAIAPNRLPEGAAKGMPADGKLPEWAGTLLHHVKENLRIDALPDR